MDVKSEEIELLEKNDKLEEDKILPVLGDQIRLLIATSHEIKSYIHNVRNLSEMLHDDPSIKPLEDVKHTLKMILNNTNTINEFLDDVLDYARTGEGGYKPKEDIDLYQITSEFIKKYKGLYDLRDAKLFVTNKTNSSKIIHANKDRIFLVLNNLMNNAIKYSTDTPHIEIVLSDLSINSVGYIQCSVIDKGIGIPEEELTKIFNLFERSTRSKNCNIPGSGVGLAICREVILSLKGKICAKNNEAGGATIKFALPKVI
jgi:signal transduction histidine kinase